jgi:hypothetical protein
MPLACLPLALQALTAGQALLMLLPCRPGMQQGSVHQQELMLAQIVPALLIRAMRVARQTAPVQALLLRATTCLSAAATPLLHRALGLGWCLDLALGMRCGAPRCASLQPPTATDGWLSSSLRVLPGRLLMGVQLVRMWLVGRKHRSHLCLAQSATDHQL